MAIKVACLTNPRLSRYRNIAQAMADGIRKCGDMAAIYDIHQPPVAADVGVMYGWKRHAYLETYPQFVYADLGYWNRKDYYRLGVGAWSPDKYVSAGLPSARLESLGVEIKPWRTGGKEIVIAGCSPKSAFEHGFAYMQWEKRVIRELLPLGKRLMYRPKPTDKAASPIPGVGYDKRPIEEAVGSAWAWVTHHSNSAVDALVAGVPVHCVTGAAAVMSTPLEQIGNPPLQDGREQFLADVAWLQWTLDEMRSGACWAHLKERGLIC